MRHIKFTIYIFQNQDLCRKLYFLSILRLLCAVSGRPPGFRIVFFGPIGVQPPSVCRNSAAPSAHKIQDRVLPRVLFLRLRYFGICTVPDRRSAVRCDVKLRRIQSCPILRQQLGDADQNHAFSVYAGAGRERYDPGDAVEIDRCGYERAAEYGPQIRPQLRRIAVQLIRFAE